MRERAIATSPAWFTSRSSTAARTRSMEAAGSAAVGCAEAGTACGRGSATTIGAGMPAGIGLIVAARSRARGERRLSIRKLMRSNAVSSSLNSEAGTAFSCTASSTRDSIWCVSSPSAMAPAMRALPLSVCSTRRSDCAGPDSFGFSRQPRSPAPISGTSSFASSRKIGSSSGSISSSMRWVRRSIGISSTTMSSALACPGSCASTAGGSAADVAYAGTAGRATVGAAVGGSDSAATSGTLSAIGSSVCGLASWSSSATSPGAASGMRFSRTAATIDSSPAMAFSMIACSSGLTLRNDNCCSARSRP